MITRETDYGIRVLRALTDGQRHTVAELSEKEFIPQAFAYKIVKKLEKAGYVQVLRGAEGGCVLRADVNKVTLYDLMVVMEDSVAISVCLAPSYSCRWNNEHGGCSVHCRLSEIQGRIERELESHSLAELFEKYA